MHLEKNILKGKNMSKKELKKEAREELKEVAEKPEKESKEAQKAIKGKKKVTGPKDNYEKKPKVGPKKRGTSNGHMVG